MKPPVQIRPIEPTDRDPVKALHKRCFPPAMALDDLVLENLMTHPYGINLVATQDDTIVAYAGAIHGARPKARLLTIHVDPEHRRLGIAQQLLDELETRLTARKADHLDLEVHTDNQAAIQLYRANGFRIVNQDETAYPNADPSTGYKMRKPLTRTSPPGQG